MAIHRSVTDTVDDSCYDIVPARGQTIHVDRGEVFENKLIDLSSGDSVFLRVTGANSEIRDVGFKGLYRGGGFLIEIDSGPGDVLFEDVYMGEGATRAGAGSVYGPGAVFVHHGNEADVTFRRCNVQGFPNNGFHCSNTASGSGSVHFDHCFGKNNGVATFRCAGGDDLIENCVAYTDSTDYGHDDEEYVEINGRPVWVWNGGTVTIRHSHFADGPYPHAIVAGANDSPGRINFESGGCRGSIQRSVGSTVDVGPWVSNDPDLSIPDGVPTTAEAAASGTTIWPSSAANTDVGDQCPHAILFDGRATSEPGSYYFEATAGVTAACDGPNGGDVVLERPISGVVADGVDAYRFGGTIETLSLRGGVNVRVRNDVGGRETRGGQS